MEKITIKELVDFRRKSDKSRKTTFAKKLKTRSAKEKAIEDEENGGGDYWITSTSCINNVYKYEDETVYDLKIEELAEKSNQSELKRTKSMYNRNIDILTNFKDFDFSDIKPKEVVKFEKVPKFSKIVVINNFPIYVNPSNVFSFEINGKKQIGSVWFVPQLEGFTKAELGMFCETLYKLLVKNYSADYQIPEKFCVAVDTYNAQKVSYDEFAQGKIPLLIDITLKEINEL